MEFRQECASNTVEGLLEQFVQQKATGSEKPGKLLYWNSNERFLCFCQAFVERYSDVFRDS
jgi:hypothetical protein